MGVTRAQRLSAPSAVLGLLKVKDGEQRDTDSFPCDINIKTTTFKAHLPHCQSNCVAKMCDKTVMKHCSVAVRAKEEREKKSR